MTPGWSLLLGMISVVTVGLSALAVEGVKRYRVLVEEQKKVTIAMAELSESMLARVVLTEERLTTVEDKIGRLKMALEFRGVTGVEE